MAVCNFIFAIVSIIITIIFVRRRSKNRRGKIIFLIVVLIWIIGVVILELSLVQNTIRTEYSAEWERGDYRSILAPAKHEVMATTPNIQILWMQEISKLDGEMSAAGGRLFFKTVGEKLLETDGIMALDGETGQVLWNISTDPNVLYATSEKLFIGTGVDLFGPYTMAFDSETGALLWRKSVRGKAVGYIYENDGLLYSSSNSKVSLDYIQQSDTGKIIFTTDSIRFVLDEERWEVVVPDSERSKFPESIDLDNFLKKNIPIGIWEREELIRNKVAVTTDIVYGLTGDGELEGRDMSGDVIYSVQFEPDVFHLSGLSDNSYTYNIAVDEELGLVYVWLGDTLQLFAFQIKE